METYKHSTRPPKSFNGFSSYDVVYGGSLAPRADEYIEIFSELHSSSSLTASSLIPILDLPAVDDVVSGFDSRFDYSEVFGEFGNVEFALPFDELFKQSDGGDCSSDEAWTPAGADSLSDSSDLWACSEKDQCFQSGDSQQPYDSKQFSASYHKVNLAFREDMAKTTHVAHLNAIPVYNYIVDEPTSLQKSDEERFCSQVADDIILSMDSLGNMTREKQISKNASHVSNDSLQSFDNYHRRERAFSSSSNPNSTFFSVSDFSHRAEPSHLPLPLMSPIVLADGPGNSFKLTSDSKASKSHAFDTTFDGSSPPFFDVVVDASSSAVIKEAIGKAQAKMESAKELIERKKDVLQNGAKPCFRSGKGIMKTSDERGVSDERLQAACEGANAEMKNPNRGSHDIMNVIEVFPDPSRAEKVTNLAGKPSQRKQEKKPSSYFDPVLIEDGEWKEATKYYEFFTVDGSEIASRRRNNANNVAQVAKSSQPKQLEDCEEDSLNLIGEFVEPKDIRPRLKATKSASRQEYHERMVKVVQEVHEQERVISEHTETEKRLKGTWERNGKDIKPKMDLKQEIDEGILDQASQAVDRRKYKEAAQDEAKMMLNNSLGRAQSKKREKEACKRDENEKIEEAFERVKEALESEEKERRMKEHGREESERRKKEPFVNEENELRLKKASNGQQNGEHLEDAYKQKTGKENWDKNKTELKEAVEKEPCGEGIRGDYEIRENGNIEEVQQRINYECKHVEEVVQEGPEEVLVEDVRQEECTKHREAIEIEKSMKWMDQANELDMDEVQKMDQKMEMVIEQEQAEKTSEEVSTELENGEVERPEGIFETCVQVEWEYTDEKPDSSPEIDFHVEGECLKVSDSACSLDENDVKQYEISCQNGKPQKETKPNEVMLGRKDGGDFKTMPLFGEGGSEAAKKAQVLIDGRQSEYLHGHVSRDASELLLGNKNTKRGTMLEENKEVPVAILGPKVIWGPNHLQGGRGNGFARVQAFSGWETDKDTENERNMEAVWSVFSEKNQSTVRRYRLSSTSQNIERNGKSINSNPTMEERAEMERLKRERELEEERLRKHEEEREREREREKDRIAVEIATQEARDRAQRAAFERATAEARQRAMAEARERLEKACAEARERSLAEKASTEARLRAERAAVERATAEARERAFEKVMAERAAFEARERIQRSISDKFSSSSREAGPRPRFLSSNSAKFESAEGEPAERCRARFERHRRTDERVAKALEEKYMRDQLVQREQAEKNRLAEILDADIRRWSSGKEGNLRALLSTLQYILGPDSGWQPIPLTEVITAAAVKKAYRKATLCVHPDKLQQRGASVQQKYVCEKVFDLLKEAWNKFNSEER